MYQEEEGRNNIDENGGDNELDVDEEDQDTSSSGSRMPPLKITIPLKRNK
jgi:hypothetical protein